MKPKKQNIDDMDLSRLGIVNKDSDDYRTMKNQMQALYDAHVKGIEEQKKDILQRSIKTLERSNKELSDTVGDVKKEVSVISSSIVDLNGRMSTMEGQITMIDGKITPQPKIQNMINSSETRILSRIELKMANDEIERLKEDKKNDETSKIIHITPQDGVAVPVANRENLIGESSEKENNSFQKKVAIIATAITVGATTALGVLAKILGWKIGG